LRQKSEFCGSIDDLAARWIKPLRFETRDDWRSAQNPPSLNAFVKSFAGDDPEIIVPEEAR
jgi:hypothetical protein